MNSRAAGETHFAASLRADGGEREWVSGPDCGPVSNGCGRVDLRISRDRRPASQLPDFKLAIVNEFSFDIANRSTARSKPCSADSNRILAVMTVSGLRKHAKKPKRSSHRNSRSASVLFHPRRRPTNRCGNRVFCEPCQGRRSGMTRSNLRSSGWRPKSRDHNLRASVPG